MSYDLAHAKGKFENAKSKDSQPVPAVNTILPSDQAPVVLQAPVSMQTADLEPLGSGYEAVTDPATTAPADSPAEKPAEPWNAPLVVGLRVFCHKTAATINVKTVKAQDVTVETKGKLDVDDPEKDAVVHAEKLKVQG